MDSKQNFQVNMAAEGVVILPLRKYQELLEASIKADELAQITFTLDISEYRGVEYITTKITSPAVMKAARAEAEKWVAEHPGYRVVSYPPASLDVYFIEPTQERQDEVKAAYQEEGANKHA